MISQFVLWGLGLWSGDMISCDIMWYHVGSGTWRSRLELDVISYYIINISCVGIRSLYHQEREMRWHMIAHDTTSRRKKDDIPIYHVSPRDMIYCDIDNDTQWYTMIATWYVMIYNDILYWKEPFLVLKKTPIPVSKDGSAPLGQHKYWVLARSGYSISLVRSVSPSTQCDLWCSLPYTTGRDMW